MRISDWSSDVCASDLPARLSDADDDRSAPAAVAAFERLAHHIGVAGAIEAVIGPAVEHIDQRFADVSDFFRIDEICHPEAAAPFLLGRIGIDANDAVRTPQPPPLEHVEADAAEAEHPPKVPWRDPAGGI